MGNKAKVIIQPRLYIDDIQASMDIIKGHSISVKSTNEIGIPSFLTFDKPILSHKQDIEIEIPIPAKCRLENLK